MMSGLDINPTGLSQGLSHSSGGVIGGSSAVGGNLSDAFLPVGHIGSYHSYSGGVSSGSIGSMGTSLGGSSHGSINSTLTSTIGDCISITSTTSCTTSTHGSISHPMQSNVMPQYSGMPPKSHSVPPPNHGDMSSISGSQSSVSRSTMGGSQHSGMIGDKSRSGNPPSQYNQAGMPPYSHPPPTQSQGGSQQNPSANMPSSFPSQSIGTFNANAPSGKQSGPPPTGMYPKHPPPSSSQSGMPSTNGPPPSGGSQLPSGPPPVLGAKNQYNQPPPTATGKPTANNSARQQNYNQTPSFMSGTVILKL